LELSDYIISLLKYYVFQAKQGNRVEFPSDPVTVSGVVRESEYLLENVAETSEEGGNHMSAPRSTMSAYLKRAFFSPFIHCLQLI
jgi:hypothetical protein